MPITKASKKALRVSQRKAAHNAFVRKKVRASVKALRKAVADKKSSEATKALKQAISQLDKAAKANIFNKHTVSRYKSRLTQLVNKAAKK